MRHQPGDGLGMRVRQMVNRRTGKRMEKRTGMMASVVVVVVGRSDLSVLVPCLSGIPDPHPDPVWCCWWDDDCQIRQSPMALSPQRRKRLVDFLKSL
jgi:hypothetical protein